MKTKIGDQGFRDFLRISCRNLDFGEIGILTNFPRQIKFFFTTVTLLGLDSIFHPSDHSYITSAKGLGGWVQKMSFFADA